MSITPSTKQRLATRVENMVGYVPPGLGDILSILVHPDVIELTKQFIQESDKA